MVFSGDSLLPHSYTRFSTFDKDQDFSSSYHCAQWLGGGWWFRDCFYSHLNGVYIDGGHLAGDGQGIRWSTWTNQRSLTRAEMKIRPN